MTRRARKFEEEESALSAQLDANRWEALFELRALEEQWARSLVNAPSTGSVVTKMRSASAHGLDAPLAEEIAMHLANAEKWQGEIASAATSAAEGLSRMAEVRELQLARAWVLASASSSGSLRRRARELCRRLERDRKDLSPSLRRELEALKAQLG